MGFRVFARGLLYALELAEVRKAHLGKTRKEFSGSAADNG
jgi:hypothetical protein